MMTPFEYAQAQADAFIDELKEVLRIPSISTLPDHAAEVRRAAEWFKDACLKAGLSRAEVIDTVGHPMVYAEWLGAGADKPTVLVYGHYDVQPVDDPRNEWLTPPFDPTIRDGKLYARGATDDKGQTFIHLKVFESIMKATGSFPINIKFMLEGEEESASPSLLPFMQKSLDLLACDLVVISDTYAFSETEPMIWYGLRGLIYTEIEVFGPKDDLHSGAFGGAVYNPAQALAEIIAKLHDPDGRIAVPGFYDDVQPLSDTERKALAAIPGQAQQILALAGVKHSHGEPDYTVVERIGGRPTLEINGLIGGWTGAGAKTVIGTSALAKVSCRLVPNQDPQKILQNLRDYVAKITPKGVRSEVRPIGDGAPAVLVPLDSKPMQLAAEAYAKVFDRQPYFQRGGGSIPVVTLYQQMLNVPVLLMGFGLPDDNLHAPNEKITINMFHKGVQTMIHFYQIVAEKGLN